MIEVVQVPTEQTTAITDLMLAAVSFIAGAYLARFSRIAPQRSRIWGLVCGGTGAAAALGAVAHGVLLSPTATQLVWPLIYLILAGTVALFGMGALQDCTNARVARRFAPLLFLIAALFFGYSLIDPDNFLPFVVFELVAMVASLCVYLWLGVKQMLKGAGLIALSIALTIVAASIQATESARFTLLMPFDHNSVYHLLQIVAVVILVAGLRVGMEDR
ncbi:MAG: DUF6962 family protein [Pseudomonadota bacterium]